MILFYWVTAFTTAMLGLASWTFLNSPDERWKRESFFYNYGAFIAYLILAFIGILVIVEMYRKSSVFRLGGFAAMSSPAAAVGLSSVYDVLVDSTPSDSPQEPMQQQQQLQQKRIEAAFRKPRRQIGYGRYHT